MRLSEGLQKKLEDIQFVESAFSRGNSQREMYLALNEDEQPEDFWFGTFDTPEQATTAIMSYYNQHPEELN